MLPRQLYNIQVLRRLVLPALKKLNPGSITVRHHWTHDPVVLDAFRHKGYWYHGKQREKQTMLLFGELVEKGDWVIEVGGHIGYITLYLAHLVGSTGRVMVFEPGPNNLTYLKKNVGSKPWIHVLERAVTDHGGLARFHIENLTGQNNSLLEHYAVRQANEANAYVGEVARAIVDVECTTLDDFLASNVGAAPSLIKIDVEGAERSVLKGMTEVLTKGRVALMVEVTEHAEDVKALLEAAGFRLFNAARKRVTESGAVRGNMFCLKEDDPRLRLFEA